MLQASRGRQAQGSVSSELACRKNLTAPNGGPEAACREAWQHRALSPTHADRAVKPAGCMPAGGSSNAGGAVLRNFFTDVQLVELTACIDPDISPNLDYYPLLRRGERFPVNDPELAPRLEPRPADDAHFLHGMLDSIARIEQEGFNLLAKLGASTLTKASPHHAVLAASARCKLISDHMNSAEQPGRHILCPRNFKQLSGFQADVQVQLQRDSVAAPQKLTSRVQQQDLFTCSGVHCRWRGQKQEVASNA